MFFFLLVKISVLLLLIARRYNQCNVKDFKYLFYCTIGLGGGGFELCF